MASDDAARSDPLRRALEELADVLPVHQVNYALIGGIAAGMRGQQRFTDDIDLLLTVPQLRLPGLLEALVERGFACDVLPTVREWLQHHMVVLMYGDVRVDWLKPVLPIYQHVLDAATSGEWQGRKVRVVTAEGLILLKLLAGRPQDLVDVNALLAANQGRLDMDWIEREWLGVFAADDPRWQSFRLAVAEYYDR
jgi:predicted nucleotidyltransferase